MMNFLIKKSHVWGLPLLLLGFLLFTSGSLCAQNVSQIRTVAQINAQYNPQLKALLQQAENANANPSQPEKYRMLKAQYISAVMNAIVGDDIMVSRAMLTVRDKMKAAEANFQQQLYLDAIYSEVKTGLGL